MTRRSQMEIQMDILRAVANGREKPTHIMYRANLSWIRLKKHIDFLIAQNLLVEKVDDGNSVYSVTTKGVDIIRYFKRIETELYPKRKGLPFEVYIQYK